MSLSTQLRARMSQRDPVEPDSPHTRHLVAVAALSPASASPAADDMIPDPSARFVRALAAQAFEVIEGLRSIAQLGSSVSVNVAHQLAHQRNLLRERNSLHHDTRRCIPSPGRMHLSRIQPRLAEATVVLHTERRSHAVAISLEWVHGKWRACELYVM